MRIWTLAAVMAALSGCAYVSKDEFVDIWDADGDGWGREEDCNDRNGFMFPYAGDVRGDGNRRGLCSPKRAGWRTIWGAVPDGSADE